MADYICKYQSYKKDFKDNQNIKQLYCSKNKCLCCGQRYCVKQQRYIISERVKSICKDFEGI